MSTVKYNSQYIITDVATVKFIEQWIIAGIGGCIHVFETLSGKFITKEEIFEGQRVHNIFADKDRNVAIIGGKMVRIFKLEREENFRLSPYASWTADDWIQYLHWLDCGNIAIVTAHNVVSLWNSRTGKKEKDIFCEVKCILYCALLNGSSWNELLVFAGTVFQQILVWAPSSLEEDTVDSPVLHTLKGHDGVIFSVSYDPGSQCICSTSDDRSVRLWSVDLQLSGGSNLVAQWKEAKITLLHTMYGHTARVWRSIIIDNLIVSVGEDSRLCVWNVDGSLQKYWKTHQGASVWSVDCSKEKNLIVTGGGDGGISLWPLHTGNAVPNLLAFHAGLCGQDCITMNRQTQNFPRRIGLTSNGNIVAVTDSGCLLYCTVLGDGCGNWKTVHQDEKLTSYCLLEMSPCRQYVALASMDGYILVFKDCSSVQGKDLILNVEEKAVTGRIFSLHWLSSDSLLSCGPHGILEMWKLGPPYRIQKMNEFELPKSREQWTSAAALRKNFLVCGDRNGSIHLYNISGHQSFSVQCPSQSFYKIHGHLGVSSLIWYGNYLHSTGRDGTLRQYLMLENEGRLECLKADKLQLEWPATTSFSVFGLLVVGFRAANFVMWSHTERRMLLTVPCGGGHRSWDWMLEGCTLKFIYLKDKIVHMYTCKTDELMKPVMQNGFHTKLISCIRQVPLLRGETCSSHRLLVSASEDTTVRLTVITQSNVLQTLAVLQSHISSVRALALCQLHDSFLVFSGGGRAQLKAWKLAIQGTQEFVPQVKCQELNSHMLRDPSKRNKKPWLSVERAVDPETRYMDLCAVALQHQDTDQRGTTVLLAAGCSDGFLRLFGFHALYNELKLVGKYSFHDRCILKVSLIQTESLRHVALTMATDGKVALWDLTTCVEELLGSEHSNNSCATSTSKNDSRPIVVDNLRPFSFVKIHQSGINSFDWLHLQGDKYLLATGGDDRALVLSLIQIVSPTPQESMHAEVVLQWRDDYAHASQITGLKLGDKMLISTAIDQRITMWNWQCDPERHSLSASVEARYCSAVADIQGLLTWNSSSFITACVHGKGMEILTVQFNKEAS